MIEVGKDGERIKISFPYILDYITKIKTIEGYIQMASRREMLECALSEFDI